MCWRRMVVWCYELFGNISNCSEEYYWLTVYWAQCVMLNCFITIALCLLPRSGWVNTWKVQLINGKNGRRKRQLSKGFFCLKKLNFFVHFTALSVRLLMSWKWSESICGSTIRHLPGSTEWNHDKPVRINGIEENIKTRHLLSTHSQCYSCSNLLS